VDVRRASTRLQTWPPTGFNWTFTIADVPFQTYPPCRSRGRESINPTNVVEATRSECKLVRDWPTEGGAKLKKFSPPNYSDFGCGPEGAFDLSLDAGWGSDAVGSAVGSNYTGPRKITVRLAKVVDITSFAVAPNGTWVTVPRPASRSSGSRPRAGTEGG
jgi:hypothetical protein